MLIGKDNDQRILVGDVWYQTTVLLVHTKDAQGRPALCKIIADDHSIELAGGEEFIIAYVPIEIMKAKE